MNDFKWFMILCSIGITCLTVIASVDYYFKSQITQAAMQNGYIQKVDEHTYRTIWVKAEHE